MSTAEILLGSLTLGNVAYFLLNNHRADKEELRTEIKRLGGQVCSTKNVLRMQTELLTETKKIALDLNGELTKVKFDYACQVANCKCHKEKLFTGDENTEGRV